MTFVTVYKYKVWNGDIREFVLSLRMGTRAAIEAVRGEIIEESATEVPVAQIDARGFTIRDLEN